jgi:hypothetical protein
MSGSVDRPVDSTIEVSVPDGSSDLIANVTQQLVTELNTEIGPVASHVSKKGTPGTKGDVVSLGQIALALLSAGITKQIAQILVQYIKRNPRYVIQVGKIKITKEYASKNDVTLINSLVQELSAKADKRK